MENGCKNLKYIDIGSLMMHRNIVTICIIENKCSINYYICCNIVYSTD